MDVLVSRWCVDLESFRFIPRSGSVPSVVMFLVYLWGLQQQRMKVLLSPHPHQDFLSFVILIKPILIAVWWTLEILNHSLSIVFNLSFFENCLFSWLAHLLNGLVSDTMFPVLYIFQILASHMTYRKQKKNFFSILFFHSSGCFLVWRPFDFMKFQLLMIP